MLGGSSESGGGTRYLFAASIVKKRRKVKLVEARKKSCKFERKFHQISESNWDFRGSKFKICKGFDKLKFRYSRAGNFCYFIGLR